MFRLAILDRVAGGRRWSWVTSLQAVVAICGCWNLAVVVVCHGHVIFRVCLLFEGDVVPACCVKISEGRDVG